jgi:hypothetical protein
VEEEILKAYDRELEEITSMDYLLLSNLISVVTSNQEIIFFILLPQSLNHIVICDISSPHKFPQHPTKMKTSLTLIIFIIALFPFISTAPIEVRLCPLPQPHQDQQTNNSSGAYTTIQTWYHSLLAQWSRMYRRK